MNKSELKEHARVLQSAIDRLKDERHRDYVKLRDKYFAAKRNLENNPQKCGGKEHIMGYMSGLIDAMALLGDFTSQITD